MGITVVTAIDNQSAHTVRVVDVENGSASGSGMPVAASRGAALSMYVPWATSAADFRTHRLDVVLEGGTTYSLWQDGDFVRVSTDGSWHADGAHVGGYPRSGIGMPAPFPVDSRTLVVQDGCVELVDFSLAPITPALQVVGGTVGFRLAADQPPPLPPGASPARSSSSAFSVAAPASDAFEGGEPGARCRVDDSGTRDAFAIDAAGIVVATRAGQPGVRLTRSASYTDHRRLVNDGDAAPNAPPFEMIASNGSRLIAKERGANRFFAATMDHLAIGGDDAGEVAIPSMYFKLDPEFNVPGARTADLLEHVKGCFRAHPAVERVPLFRTLLERAVADFMIVRMTRRTWHLLDARPPMSKFDTNFITMSVLRLGLAPMQGLSGALSAFGINGTSFQKAIAAWSAIVARMPNDHLDAEMQPPPWVTVYDDVRYTDGSNAITLKSIRYAKVLDIGVGYVHLHEQYEGVTGGELQPLKTGPLNIPGVDGVTYLGLYQLVNGPIRDADCYIDGTCNYYLLVQLAPAVTLGSRSARNPAPPGGPDAYGLLFIDEQSFFTGRWRLAHPDDCKGLTGVTKDLQANPALYGWNPATYWCPFRAGLVNDFSRLAVSRQVAVVNGVDAAGTPVLYSINFSYSTIDRTWRWRSLPPNVQTPADGVPPLVGDVPPSPNTVYPETVGLREDMTLHVRGRDAAGRSGRWYQRYLPAGNTMSPPAEALVANQRPATGYAHEWKFLPDAAFDAADRFSHFGVYDKVDSRTQYYALDGVPDGVSEGPWVDATRKLSVRCVKFWWAAPLYPDIVDKRPPSLFNPDTRLRIVRRGSRWIAMHWDKRDDKLVSFDGLPLTVPLTNAVTNQTITVTLGANVRVEQPPAARTAYVWFDGADAVMAFTPPVPGVAWTDNVARVRMAALTGGMVFPLLDVRTADPGAFTLVDGCYRHRWTPSGADAQRLRECCSPDGVLSHATSVWFEDVVGHVATPESAIVWGPPPSMRVTVTPAALPYGIAVASLIVHAVDAQTGAALSGKVRFSDGLVDLDRPFGPRTFRQPDPDGLGPDDAGRGARPLPRAAPDRNAAVVVVPGYPETPVPFAFYVPAMSVSVDVTSFTIGQSRTFTVHATDAVTHAAVRARVMLGTAVLGDTDAPITHAFAANEQHGSVVAAGYDPVPITFSLAAAPQPPAIVGITVDPAVLPPGRAVQVLVRAQDSNTKAFIDGGVVKINGTVVGSTNARFAFTAPRPKIVGPRLQRDDASRSLVITVSKAGYLDGSLELDDGP